MSRGGARGLAAALVTLAGALPVLCASTRPANEGFRRANEAVRAGDYPKALGEYRRLAEAGERSAALYWNWAQVAQAQGARGEAVWALLQARERDPGDAAVGRGLDRLREELNLDPAELAPSPLAQWRLWARRLHLDLAAAGLLLISLAAHALSRGRPRALGRAAAWTCFGLGMMLVSALLLASRGRPTAVVVHRAAALFDAASPSAEALDTLREGEVVPVLARSVGYLRIEDSAGARGWAREDDVVVIDEAP
jgi:hypothetical protein